jgi:hypothetical protein
LNGGCFGCFAFNVGFRGRFGCGGESCGDAIANGVGDGPSLAMRLKMYDDAWVTLNHIF